MATPLFDRLLALCGKRCDDPELVAFHAEEGLPPPPTSLGRHTPERVRHTEHGYDLWYIATLKRPESWPPRVGAKGFVTYLQRVDLRKGFAPHLPAPFALDLDPARAQALALRWGRSRETHVHTVYRLYEQGERYLEVRFGPISETKPMYTALTIDQVDDDDPRLESITREALEALDRKAERLTPPPPRSQRTFPERALFQSAPFPPVLMEARQALMAERADSAGDEEGGAQGIDFDFYDDRRVEFMAPSSKSEEHEAEFYVFGADGTGSSVGFWLVHDAPLAEQPVVFIGSEGDDNRPVAKDLPNFLALLAAGIGPREASLPPEQPQPLPAVRAVVEKYFPDYSACTPNQIIEDATAQYRDFDARMEELYYDQRMACLAEYDD